MFGFYLLTKLSDFVCCSIIVGLFSTIGAFIATIAYYNDCSYWDEDEKQERLKHYHIKGLWIIVIISWLIATLVPTTKQAAFIWLAPQIVENGAVKDTVKNIPELAKLGTEYLKELLEEKIND